MPIWPLSVGGTACDRALIRGNPMLVDIAHCVATSFLWKKKSHRKVAGGWVGLHLQRDISLKVKPGGE